MQVDPRYPFCSESIENGQLIPLQENVPAILKGSAIRPSVTGFVSSSSQALVGLAMMGTYKSRASWIVAEDSPPSEESTRLEVERNHI